MLFEISDRLAQAFCVDLVWLGLGRVRCIPCAGLFFQLGFRLVILIHANHRRLKRNSYEGSKNKGRSPRSLAHPFPDGRSAQLARSNEPGRAVIKPTYAPVLIGHMDAASVNIAGLLLALVGILLFFRYGMAHRARADGEFDVAHEAEPNIEKRDDVLGWIGLTLVVFATLVIPAFMR